MSLGHFKPAHQSDKHVGGGFRSDAPPTSVHPQEEQSASELASADLISLSETLDERQDPAQNSGHASAVARNGAGKMAAPAVRQPETSEVPVQHPAVRGKPWVAVGGSLFKIGAGIAMLCLNIATSKSNRGWQEGVGHCEHRRLACNEQDAAWLEQNGFMGTTSTNFPVLNCVLGGVLILDGLAGLCVQASNAWRAEAHA